MLRALSTALNKEGMKSQAAFFLSHIGDYMFDIKYGTDTVSWVNLKNLRVVGKNRKRASMYQPTHVYPLKKLFEELNIPQGKIFIDLGCGKGRVLLVASEFGFKELRGIEFASELCKTAVTNCSVYKDKTGTKAEFQIIESDVVDYDIHDEDVFFMFHPFDDFVLRQVLRKITLSLLMNKRKIWIIYRNPVHKDIIGRMKEFIKVKDVIFWGSDFLVFTNITDY